MPKPYITENTSPYRQLAGKRYVKEILREGTYQHPITPWAEPLDATPEYLGEVAERSNAALAAGVECPFPDGHVDDAKDNTGWAKRFFVGENDEGTESLFAEADITDPEYQQKIDDGSITKVSVFLSDHGDGQFDPGGDRVVHVAHTSYPVASPQSGFVALSVGGTKNEVPVLVDVKEIPMKFAIPAAKARALGLTVPEGTEDTTKVEFSSDDVLDRLEAALNDKAEATTAVESLEGEKAELETQLAAAQDENAPADIVKALSVDPKQERFFKRSKESLDAVVKGEVDALVADGKIHADTAEELTVLLSIDHSYALALDGKATEQDVPALVRKILAALPKQAAVPMGDRVTKDGVEINAPNADGKSLSAEEAQAVADRMLGKTN